jgi:hypothetical protein
MLYGPKDNGLQFVFETTNAAFVGGGCENRRVANAKLGKLRTPTEGNADITVIAGWALGYDSVKITPTFTLIAGVAASAENNKAQEVPDTNSQGQAGNSDSADGGTERREEDGNREEQRSVPAASVEPIKLNLRGGKASARTPDASAAPAVDAPAAVLPAKSAAVKLSARVADTQPPPASQADPSEPEGAVQSASKLVTNAPDAPAESEQQREARLAAEIRTVATAAAAVEAAQNSAAAQRDAEAVSKAAVEADRKAALEAVEAAAEMDRKAAVQAAVESAATRDASLAAAAAVETKKQKIQLEDLDRLDAGEDVDAAIEKMQAMIKAMKNKKKVAKETEGGAGNWKKVKDKVQKVDRKTGRGAAKGITLDVGGKKGASGSAKEGIVLQVASTRTNRNAAGGEVPAEDADGEGGNGTENESEADAEEEEDKPQEKASEVRLRRSKRKSELAHTRLVAARFDARSNATSPRVRIS